MVQPQSVDTRHVRQARAEQDAALEAYHTALARRGWQAGWSYQWGKRFPWHVVAWPAEAEAGVMSGRHVRGQGATHPAAYAMLVVGIDRAECTGMAAQWVEEEDAAPPVPPRHREEALCVLDLLPPEWTRVEAGPAYAYQESRSGMDIPDAYLGVRFRFYQHIRMLAFLVEEPRVLLQAPAVLDMYLARVRRGFRQAETEGAMRIARAMAALDGQELQGC